MENLGRQITLGNIVTWAILIGTVGMLYGALSRTVTLLEATNERQDASIGVLREGYADMRVDIGVLQQRTEVNPGGRQMRAGLGTRGERIK